MQWGKLRWAACTLAALATLTLAPAAAASHPRPKAASPFQASLVPAYDQCVAPNRTHGPPLDYPACAPAADHQSSHYLSVGTADANGAAAQSTASVRLSVVVGVPGPPDDSDVSVVAGATDIRCKSGTLTCGAPNDLAGADYTGELQGIATIRISDHFNAVAEGGGSDPATVADFAFSFVVPCTATTGGGGSAIGSSCAVDTTANALIPGTVTDRRRALVELGPIELRDGGADGVIRTDPNTLLAIQGVFVP